MTVSGWGKDSFNIHVVGAPLRRPSIGSLHRAGGNEDLIRPASRATFPKGEGSGGRLEIAPAMETVAIDNRRYNLRAAAPSITPHSTLHSQLKGAGHLPGSFQPLNSLVRLSSTPSRSTWATQKASNWRASSTGATMCWESM